MKNPDSQTWRSPLLSCYFPFDSQQRQLFRISPTNHTGSHLLPAFFINVTSVLKKKKKKRQQSQHGVTYAKHQVTKARLKYSFCFPGNGILNQSVRNHLLGPYHPLKEGDLATTDALSAGVSSSFPLLLPMKSFIFYSSLELLSVH